jgi:hypothetical protein
MFKYYVISKKNSWRSFFSPRSLYDDSKCQGSKSNAGNFLALLICMVAIMVLLDIWNYEVIMKMWWNPMACSPHKLS